MTKSNVTGAPAAASNINALVLSCVANNKLYIETINALLTTTKNTDKTTATSDQVIAAGGDSLASLNAFLANLKSAVNAVNPSTYP